MLESMLIELEHAAKSATTFSKNLILDCAPSIQLEIDWVRSAVWRKGTTANEQADAAQARLDACVATLQ
jgi:hypothetical protein